jgi:hypothetical protein
MGAVSRHAFSEVLVEDQVMRTIVALTVIAATLALGGCFHHRQAVAEIPMETTPYK